MHPLWREEAARPVPSFDQARPTSVVQAVPQGIRPRVPRSHEAHSSAAKEEAPPRASSVVSRFEAKQTLRRLRKRFSSFGDDVGPSAGLTQNHRGEHARTSEALQQTRCPRRDREVRARMRKLSCSTLTGETGRSSAWLERCVWDAEVAGSSPAAPTRTRRTVAVPFLHALLRPVRARKP